jgi:hypothetical protein
MNPAKKKDTKAIITMFGSMKVMFLRKAHHKKESNIANR